MIVRAFFSHVIFSLRSRTAPNGAGLRRTGETRGFQALFPKNTIFSAVDFRAQNAHFVARKPTNLPRPILRRRTHGETRSHSEQGPAVLVLDSGIMTMHRLAERKRQLAPGLTMTFPFMFGWIEHK